MTLRDRTRVTEAAPRADGPLHAIFERTVDRLPGAVALLPVGDEPTRTYAELDAEANRLAHFLRARGAGPGRLVGLLFERSTRPIVAILACLKAGAGYVPLEPGYPEDRIRYIVDEAGIELILTERAVRGLAEAAAPGTPVALDEPSVVAELAALPGARLDPAALGLADTDLCYVIYTSGTTGRPKGVMCEHRNARDFVLAFDRVCSTNERDRVYQGFALTFDGSVEEIWMAFATGAALVVPDRTTPRFGDDLAEVLERLGVTYFSTVPTMLSTIGRDLPSLRQLVVSGEVCPPALVERWAAPDRRMLNVYGPTEATVNTTAVELRPGRPVTIGRPIPGYTVHLLDETLRPVPHGAEGELYVGGVGVSRGYLGRPDLTAERYVTSPHVDGGETRLYRTGDLVRWREDGDLDFFGRLDGQVKIRGFRVELAEIESVLRSHPAVGAAAARLAERDGIPVLAAYVVPRDAAVPPEAAELAALLEARLPDYMVPGYLDLLAELPLLTSGKTDRSRLPAPVVPLASAGTAFVEPRTPHEVAVTAAWAELFGMERVSAEADFFADLGGHSLLAARSVALLRERHGSELAVRDLYAFPTPRALAATLVEREAVAAMEASHDRAARAGDAPDPALGSGGAVRPRSSGAAARLGDALRPRSRARTVPSAAPSAAETFAATPAILRHATAFLMGLSVGPLTALPLLPLLVFGLLEVQVLAGDLPLGVALLLGLGAGVLGLPAGLLLSILAKWLLIGRYRPGVHALWTPFHWRAWLVDRLVGLSGARLLLGTPLLPLYYRAMGARVGRRVMLETLEVRAWDLLSIGDDCSVGPSTVLFGSRVEAGRILLDRVELGRRVFVGSHVHLGIGVRLEDDSRLDDQSMLPDGAVIPAGEGRRGSPPVPAEIPLPVGEPYRPSRSRRLGFGLVQVAAGLTLDTLMALPALTLYLGILALGLEDGLGVALLVLALVVPGEVVLSALWFALLRRAVLPTGRPGQHRLYGEAHLRKWCSDLVVQRARTSLYTIQTTLYLPYWLRLMGARIGARSEFSTIRNISPELTVVGEESFFADDVGLGGRRVFDGRMSLSVDRVGRRTFVGNSAHLPPGSELGNGCLLGVLSAAPVHVASAPDGTDWLGSPAFQLANRQKDHAFDERLTYRPTRSLYLQRAVIDGLRILLPTGWLLTLAQLETAAALAIAEAGAPLAALLLLPAVGLAGTVASILVTVAAKRLVMGTFEPVVVPLWSRYVWRNELANGFYEAVMLPAIAPLLGTPFVAPPLRAMGVHVGRHVYLDAAWLTEWDLVEIGDHATLNDGATLQTHLFEDRVMKSSWTRVADGATVGAMSVVLYDAVIEADAVLGALSLVMKGEAIPAGRRAHGIPSAALGRAVEPPAETPARPADPGRGVSGARSDERLVVLTRDGWAVGRAASSQVERLLATGRGVLELTASQGPCPLRPDEILLLMREDEQHGCPGEAGARAPRPGRVDLGWAVLDGRIGSGAGPFVVVHDAALRRPDGETQRVGRVHLAQAAREGASLPVDHPLAERIRTGLAAAG